MKTTNNYNPFSTYESLKYDSLFSKKEFTIDLDNILHIRELSIFNKRNESISIDQINPVPVSKKHLNKSLFSLGLTSILISFLFFGTALFMEQLWTASFALVFSVFGAVTLFASFKNNSNTYEFMSLNNEDVILTLSEPSYKDNQVSEFLKVLESRINQLSNQDKNVHKYDFDAYEENMYRLEKQSQYTKHLDFLFNHGIVDEVLYRRLYKNINQKIDNSENRFIETQADSVNNNESTSNVIYFPVNA